jgi:RimJ/RimL family protein N-acetyltransferase
MQLFARPMFRIPTLETERLLLRGHRKEDLGDCFGMWSDPEVVRYIGGKPSTREQCWARLLRYVGHWEVMGFGFWALEEKRTGRFVGELGLADFHREIAPPFGDTPEAGWALAPWAQGQGFATEGLSAALTWADAHLPSLSSVCLISAENLVSFRVAAKCGYTELRRLDYLSEPSVILERTRVL